MNDLWIYAFAIVSFVAALWGWLRRAFDLRQARDRIRMLEIENDELQRRLEGD